MSAYRTFRDNLDIRRSDEAPGVPRADAVRYYVNTDGDLIRVGPDGSETTVGAGGGPHTHDASTGTDAPTGAPAAIPVYFTETGDLYLHDGTQWRGPYLEVG